MGLPYFAALPLRESAHFLSPSVKVRHAMRGSPSYDGKMLAFERCVLTDIRVTKKEITHSCDLFFGDPYGNRTHVTAVKGRCLNRLTNGPYGSGNLT